MPDKSNLSRIANDPLSSAEERAQAQRELDADVASVEIAEGTLSADARNLLTRFKKRHLSEVTEDEWETYVRERGITGRDPLTKEFRDSVPADSYMLGLLGMSLLDWWKAILKHATRQEVRANAAAKIANLKATEE